MSSFRAMASLFVFSLLTCGLVRGDDAPIKTGDKIAFLGDSITQGGAGHPGGYVQLVGSGLAAAGVKVEIIGAGISGHKSNQMLERLDRDVISKKPTWMTLSCGVNDVWHGAKGVPLEAYQKNITEIVDKAQAAGIQVMILTSTMIHEDAKNDTNQKLAPYNDFLRKLATDKKCLLADLNADMQAAIQPAAAGGKQVNLQLTSDGVHMGPLGDRLMAAGILKAFGLSEEQLKQANEAWLDGKTASVQAKQSLTLRQYEQLSKLALGQGKSVNELVNDEVGKTIEALLKAAP
jgi:lysophospholipase L1-like esterase